MNIALKGDANTEQSAKLELIRILQERLNKLTVAQLNSRVIVSSGVKNYYKVPEIFAMHDKMWALRGQLIGEADALAKGNPGFGEAGNNFVWTYMRQFNEAMTTAGAVKNQTKVLITDGSPIQLPAMPTFSISPQTSDPGADMVASMKAVMDSYGVHSQDEMNALPADKQAEIKAKLQGVADQFKTAMDKMISDGNKKSLSIIGNVVGMAFGVPGLGNMIVGLASGDASALAGLVGSIVDRFQIPTDYYDSPTLKLTDSERLKMIDELHTRISECLQKGIALRANMNSEVKKRYDNISQTRNETILYGPKK